MTDYHDDREEEEEQATLLLFGVKKSEDFPDWLLVTCPHEGCGSESFLVHEATWRATYTYTTHREQVHIITGRSCPYCFRTARIPPKAGRRKR